jgi:hypothetical protein
LIEEIVLIDEGSEVVEAFRIEGDFVGEDLAGYSKPAILLVSE